MDRQRTLTRMFYSVEERPEAELCNQLQKGTAMVDAAVHRPLTDFQHDALVCLASDLVAGYITGQLEGSLLARAINRGMFQVAAAEFNSFCRCGSQFVKKARDKRRAEQHLFSSGTHLFS